jgi:hypothetical protein
MAYRRTTQHFGLGQTYPNGQVQMPYSNVLIQGWSDAAGNLSPTWQGYYLATYGSGILPPILSGATVLSSSGAGTLNGQLTLVITDTQVQAILHGNNAATPAGNYIPNQTVAPPKVIPAGVFISNDPAVAPTPTMTGQPVQCTTAQCLADMAALNSGTSTATASTGLFGFSSTQLLIGAAVLAALWAVSQ